MVVSDGSDRVGSDAEVYGYIADMICLHYGLKLIENSSNYKELHHKHAKKGNP